MSALLFHMIAGAPEPVAPFSHGVEQDGWVFVMALSNACVLRRSPGKKVGEGSCARPFYGHGRVCNLPPGLESWRHLLTGRGSGVEGAPQAEMRRDRAIGGEEALGMPWRFEAWHAPLPLTHVLVRLLGTVIPLAVLTMFDARQALPFGGTIAGQRSGDEHPWHLRQTREPQAEELLGRHTLSRRVFRGKTLTRSGK
jgi:hypothetical protein